MRFGRYESLFRIASGGMAEVFAARLPGEAGFSKLVAVKRILPNLEDSGFTDMFLEEARVAAQLTSPHIVQTLDMGRTEDGVPFIVQELVVGVDLLELLVAAAKRKEKLPLPVAMELLAQAAVGLHEAHEARAIDGRPMQLVHRDVSPHNLLVGADGRVRLTDFGIARVAFDRLVETRAGTLKGKLAYLSPEQARGERVERRSDIFSLGVVAWETLTGRRLFYRPSPTMTLDAVERMPIPALTDLRPSVPAAIEALIATALERDVDARLSSARALADGLRELAREHSLVATEVDVAASMEHLAPPRLVELRTRIRDLTRQPRLETLPDIDLPSPESHEQTLAQDFDDETEFDANPGWPMLSDSEHPTMPRESLSGQGLGPASGAVTRPRAPAPVAGAQTVLLQERREPRTTVHLESPRVQWIALGVVAALGVLLLVGALLVLVSIL